MWAYFVKGECKKSSIFWMLLFLLSQAYFLLFLEPWDKRKVSQKNLYCMLEIRVLKNLSPNCMRVILKEHDTVNSTANLSTWRHLTNQSMIPKSGIMERRHQRLSPGSASLCPSPGYHLAPFACRYFSYLTPFSTFFPHCGAWSQVIANSTLDDKMDLHKFALGKYVAKMCRLRSKCWARMVNASHLSPYLHLNWPAIV